jgi:hypothetical protein
MGLFGDLTTKPTGTAGTAGSANRPAGLTPAAKQYLDRAVELSKSSTSGAITPENSAELRKLAMQLKPEDLRSMRYNEADRDREKLMPITKDPDPTRSGAAKSLLKVLDAGILPGMGQNGVWIDSGQPCTREDVLRAKGELPAAGAGSQPQPQPPAKKSWW